MNDIHFACPHCGQHIACGVEFFDMTIPCPGCAMAMVVPRVDPDTPHEPGFIVPASAVRPPKLPAGEAEPPGQRPKTGPARMFAAVVVAILYISCLYAGLDPLMTSIAGLTGAAIVVVLAIRGKRVELDGSPGDSVDQFVLTGLRVFAILALTPFLLFGVLFAGCAVCGAAGR
jgi:hypothetical protein